MKSVIFDVDNTLYSEMSYVKSGFIEVSKYLSNKYKLDCDMIFKKMIDIFDVEGRGKVFNILLDDLNLSEKENVLNLVYIYRFHAPNISLYDDVLDTLIHLKEKNYKLGIITDGRALVQKNKIDALNLNEIFDVIILTDALGSDFWKPSIVPYQIALDLLDSNPNESCYIGDDSFKDFLGPKSLNMKSIQVQYEEEIDYWKKRGFNQTKPDHVVKSLQEIFDYL
ncbi:HAD family hydrolase [Methanobrevibacter sp.]|uniref:HAD family hydrolase n=1 Tax=Methanobrevibacter sp. TaxID=66852 RepID=UPI00386CD8B8